VCQTEHPTPGAQRPSRLRLGCVTLRRFAAFCTPRHCAPAVAFGDFPPALACGPRRSFASFAGGPCPAEGLSAEAREREGDCLNFCQSGCLDSLRIQARRTYQVSTHRSMAPHGLMVYTADAHTQHKS
jgi:hypothetical protein